MFLTPNIIEGGTTGGTNWWWWYPHLPIPCVYPTNSDIGLPGQAREDITILSGTFVRPVCLQRPFTNVLPNPFPAKRKRGSDNEDPDYLWITGFGKIQAAELKYRAISYTEMKF